MLQNKIWIYVMFSQFHKLPFKVLSTVLFLYFEVVCDPHEVIITMASIQIARIEN
jgi:hypothetical protein